MNNTLTLWEDTDLTEPWKKSESKPTSVPNDGINETNNASVKNECENTGSKKIKQCVHCKQSFPIDHFYKLVKSKDGHGNHCRKCREYMVKRSYEKMRKLNPLKLRNRENQYRKDNPVKRWANTSLCCHRKKFRVNITVKELEELGKITSRCSLCDCWLSWGGNMVVKDNSPSLDRIDNGSILSKDNIQIICHKCNCTKRNRTMKEFLDYCQVIVNKFNIK